MSDLNFGVAQNMLQDARDKVSSAAALANEAHNLLKQLNAAGYQTDAINGILATFDGAINALELTISQIDGAL